MSTTPARRSPLRGRFFDEHTDPNAPKAAPNGTPAAEAVVDPANYRLLIEQLVLCNDEIERLAAEEERLLAENEELRQRVGPDHAAAAPQGTAPQTPPKDAVAPGPGHPADAHAPADATVPHTPDAAAEDGGKPLRPYLGVEVMDRGSEVVVKNLLTGGGADEAGVQVGDVLLDWNAHPIGTRHRFGQLVSQAEIGTIVKLLVERGARRQRHTLRVEVKGTSGAKSPSRTTPPAKAPAGAHRGSKSGTPGNSHP
jgi:hypothetical protein